MSDQFSLHLVKDKRLDVKPSVGYGVYKGAQSIYQNQYKATSESNSSINFNFQVPSENILVCRRIMFMSTVTFQITSSYTSGNDIFPANYGFSEAFCAFPLQSMMSNMTATINNCTVSTPMQDVICIIMRMMTQAELSMYEGGTPTFQDQYASYTTNTLFAGPANNAGAYTPNNNPLGSYVNAIQYDFIPRGSFKVNFISTVNPAANPPILSSSAVNQMFFVQATFIEPLLISPFVWGANWDDPALLGIQTLNFTFNIGAANRIWRSGTPRAALNSNSTSVMSVSNSNLLITYLTPHPSDLISVRNSQPYYQIVPYKQPVQIQTGAGSQLFNSNNLQLGCVPDKLFVLLRPPLSLCDMTVPDLYAAIQKINIQWNANSGILNNATTYELWQMSQASGCTMSWLEWSGQFVTFTTGGKATSPAATWNTSYAGNGPVAGFGMNTLLTPQNGCGSIAVFDMGRFVQIVEEFFSAGSIGQFSLSLQVICNVPNINLLSNAQQNWELVIAVMNSGFFTTEKGSSSVTINILSKQDVLDASAMSPSYNQDLTRLIGGNFLSNLKSAIGNIYNGVKSIVPVASQVVGLVNPKYAPYSQAASVVASALPEYHGNGQTGGGETGGRSLKERMRR